MLAPCATLRLEVRGQVGVEDMSLVCSRTPFALARLAVSGLLEDTDSDDRKSWRQASSQDHIDEGIAGRLSKQVDLQEPSNIFQTVMVRTWLLTTTADGKEGIFPGDFPGRPAFGLQPLLLSTVAQNRLRL